MTAPFGNYGRPCGSVQAALDAVLALHAKQYDGYIYQDVCVGCTDPDSRAWTLWPCPTIQAIEAHMGTSEGVS